MNTLNPRTESLFIFKFFDQMFSNAKFELVDDILLYIDEEDHDTNALLSLLTASLPAKTKLPSRQAFYHRVKNFLEREMPTAEVRELLRGLE